MMWWGVVSRNDHIVSEINGKTIRTIEYLVDVQ